MSLGLLFLWGSLTGFHCVGMCGGFVVSYAAADARAGRSSFVSHLSYGAGKTLSYTAIGAAFGWLGAFIAFTPLLRGVAGVAAGAFLIIFGLNMLGPVRAAAPLSARTAAAAAELGQSRGERHAIGRSSSVFSTG